MEQIRMTATALRFQGLLWPAQQTALDTSVQRILPIATLQFQIVCYNCHQ